MKKTKIDKKKIYCLNIEDDFGELWLGHNKEPIAFYHFNDASFREEYLGFIFDYLNVEFVRKPICVEDNDLCEQLYEKNGDKRAIAELLKEEINKL